MKPISPQLARISNFADVARMAADLQTFLNQFSIFAQALGTPPAAGTVRLVALDENGNLQLFNVVAGAGVTITPNLVNQTWTISSP